MYDNWQGLFVYGHGSNLFGKQAAECKIKLRIIQEITGVVIKLPEEVNNIQKRRGNLL